LIHGNNLKRRIEDAEIWRVFPTLPGMASLFLIKSIKNCSEEIYF